LLLLGFGVKAGLPLLHFWLPLAHPVAPTPASAVLSGAMIKAGLLGWVLLLPLGLPGQEWLGQGLVLAGAVGALGGALLGLMQREPKTILAYSSISQMGLMTLLVGAAVAAPGEAAVMVPVIGLYALHHGLAKGALFLATGLARPAHRGGQALWWGLVALPGLSLAGLPLTSGAVAKLAMKSVLVPDLPGVGLAALLPALMSAGALATTLVVMRFLWCLQGDTKSGRHSPWMLAGWGGLTLVSLVLFWWLPWRATAELPPMTFGETGLRHAWSLLWPIMVGLLLTLVLLLIRSGRTARAAPARADNGRE
jgi:hydrogenase-4 component B